MDLSKMALFNMAKHRLDWAAQRQTVIAQNVANADTPGYRPSDVRPLDFSRALRQAMSVPSSTAQPGAPTAQPGNWGAPAQGMPGTLPVAPITAASAGAARVAAVTQTHPGHSPGTLPQPPSYRQDASSRSYDTTINGNKVVLEEQMLKVSSTRREYETSMNLFRKHLTMLRTALGKK